ncbi:MAG: triose-phosphate isomerase family protein [bacterium]
MFLIVATFKSNKTQSEVASWLKEVSPAARSSQAQIVVAPSFPYLSLVSSPFSLCAQDVSPFPPGSYTGAVSAGQLKDLSVKYCLIGHSERRRYFHETSVEIASKAENLLEAGITPILCLADEDITPQLAALSDSLKSKIIYCFEPPADIGGTETAPLDNIKSVLTHLTSLLGPSTRLMYGGSVNADNLASLLSLPLTGVLVSTASLKTSDFLATINSYHLSSKA